MRLFGQRDKRVVPTTKLPTESVLVPSPPAPEPKSTDRPQAPTPASQALSMLDAFERCGISRRHVEFARDSANQANMPLASLLRDLGLATGEQIARAMAMAHGLEYVDPRRVDDLDLEELRFDLLRERARESMVPIASDRLSVVVAVADDGILNGTTVDLATIWAPYRVTPAIASRETLALLWRRLYADTHAAVLLAESADSNSPTYTRDLFESLLRHACFTGCSDLHLSPTPLGGFVRVRRDGLIHPYRYYRRQTFDRLLGLIANEGAAKDIITTKEASYPPPADLADRYGFRVQLTQSIRGMACVIRVLDRQSAVVDFDRLGFDVATAQTIRSWSRRSEGMVLVSGPTGSGKSTTMFAVMRMVDSLAHAIFTIENPVELHCPTWVQTHAAPVGDSSEAATFRVYIKGFMRCDPDQCLVGEMRDLETCLAGIDLASTGHLVYGTVHANDAVRTVQRLEELGVSAHALSSVLTGVLAQRLVPRLCPHCKAPDTDPKTREVLLGHSNCDPHQAVGCTSCDGTGFRGRLLVYELLDIDDAMRDGIARGDGYVELQRRLARPERMWGRGLALVAAGETTLSVLRAHVGEC